MISRLNGKLSAHRKPSSKAIGAIKKSLVDGVIAEPQNCKQAKSYAEAITTLEKTSASLADLLSALRRSKELAESDNNGDLISAIYKAACRLDELFYFSVA